MSASIFRVSCQIAIFIHMEHCCRCRLSKAQTTKRIYFMCCITRPLPFLYRQKYEDCLRTCSIVLSLKTLLINQYLNTTAPRSN